MRDETGRLANKVYFSSPIVSFASCPAVHSHSSRTIAPDES